jgi:hypothetical protein
LKAAAARKLEEAKKAATDKAAADKDGASVPALLVVDEATGTITADNAEAKTTFDEQPERDSDSEDDEDDPVKNGNDTNKKKVSKAGRRQTKKDEVMIGQGFYFGNNVGEPVVPFCDKLESVWTERFATKMMEMGALGGRWRTVQGMD